MNEDNDEEKDEEEEGKEDNDNDDESKTIRSYMRPSAKSTLSKLLCMVQSDSSYGHYELYYNILSYGILSLVDVLCHVRSFHDTHFISRSRQLSTRRITRNMLW